MNYFSHKDLKAIESLKYDPLLEPRFDSIKYCLIWEDEMPKKISTDGYEKLCDLWITRSLIFHRKLPKEEWGLDPDYFENVWKKAISANFKWPGFLRLNLSPEDRKYLFDEINNSKKSL